jgi:pectate lyase-like protein
MTELPLRPDWCGDTQVHAAGLPPRATAGTPLRGLPPLGARRQDLLPRFATVYQHLRAQPRRLRRRLQRHWKQSLAGVALLLTLQPTTSGAATFTAGTATELSTAITTANSTGEADIITLTADITLTAANNTPYGPTGLPVITSELTIQGNGHTIERASGAPHFRILAVNSAGVFALEQTTIKGGSSTGAFFGGGIYNHGGSVYLSACTISGNSAPAGGGIENYDGRASLTLYNSTVSDNVASDAGGGIDNYAHNNGAVTVLQVIKSTVSGNTASTDGGGGIINRAWGDDQENPMIALAGVNNSTISGNTAAGPGGGLRNSIVNGLVSLTLSDSTVSGNAATHGGGMFQDAFLSKGATLTLARNLIAGNTAATSSEIGNVEYTSGVIGAVNANNHNLFGHSGLTNAQAFSGFTPGSGDITATSGGTTPTALPAILDTVLTDNGGLTFTHALVQGSPALDVGSLCSVTDQRGVSRPQGSACDSGAFEFAPSDVPVTATLTSGQVQKVGTDEASAAMSFTATAIAATALAVVAEKPEDSQAAPLKERLQEVDLAQIEVRLAKVLVEHGVELAEKKGAIHLQVQEGAKPDRASFETEADFAPRVRLDLQRWNGELQGRLRVDEVAVAAPQFCEEGTTELEQEVVVVKKALGGEQEEPFLKLRLRALWECVRRKNGKIKKLEVIS